jgi:hypothetical protein
MRRLAHFHEDLTFRAGAGAAGGVLLASAALAADLARDHMILFGTICGADHVPHCGWCYSAAGLAIAGLAAFAVALAPARPTAA